MENVNNIVSLIWIIIIYALNAYAVLSIKEFFSKKEILIPVRVGIIVLVFLINNDILPIVLIKYVDHILLIIYFIFLFKRRRKMKDKNEKKSKKKTHK